LKFQEAGFGFHFTERDGSPVAQLTCPVSKLMTTITLSVGLHTGDRSATTEDDADLIRALKAEHCAHCL
jgi:hypothetical protein